MSSRVALFGRVRTLLEMIRFSHTIFALPFALVSALLAWQEYEFRWLDVTGIVLCMVFARSAAMAFNRIADRHYDAANPRTAGRHIPKGQLSVASVWIFTLLCATGFIASTFLFYISGNPWPAYLSLPVLLFIAAYSYTKRFTLLCHFWLGASLLLAPLATWIAICGMREIIMSETPSRLEITWPFIALYTDLIRGSLAFFAQLVTPLCLGLAVLFWVAGFDILYACQDVDFDRRTRLASIPAKLGVPAALRIAFICHILMIVFLVVLFWAAKPHLGVIYLTGVGAVTLLLAYEHWLVRPDDLSRVNQVFFNINGVISVGLLLVVLLQLAVKI